MKRPQLRGIEVQARSCGRTACENDAIAFWQSRMTVAGGRADPIALADLRDLACRIRRAYADPYYIEGAVNTVPAGENPIMTIAEFYRLTCEAAAPPLRNGPASDTPNPNARNPSC